MERLGWFRKKRKDTPGRIVPLEVSALGWAMVIDGASGISSTSCTIRAVRQLVSNEAETDESKQ